ncbi:hypothetical protein Gpo141_00005949 [Globisporangium polare]
MATVRSIVLLVLCAVMAFGLGHATETPPVYTIGQLVIGGSGCRPESVSAVPSTDNTSVSVLFSSFEAKTNNDATRVRSACAIALPVNALPGQSIGLFKVDYRGYVYVPNVQRASAALSNEYFFAGQQGIRIKRTYQPGDSMDIFESNSINFQSVIWSPCGGSTTFRVNTAIMAARPAQSPEDVQIFVDSLDATVHGSIQIAVASRKCDPLTGEPL